MDEKTKKYLVEIADLLSSAEAKIFELLQPGSKETFMTEEIVKKGEMTREEGAQYEKDHSDEFDVKKETNAQETIQGLVRLVTELAVQIVVGINATWIPKSAIKNLNSIVLEQGKPVSADLAKWFVPKVEWKAI